MSIWQTASRFAQLTTESPCYTLQWADSFLPQNCLWTTVVVPWGYPSPQPKRRLDRFSRFCRTYDCDRQTDRPPCSVCNNAASTYVILRCGLKSKWFYNYEASVGSCVLRWRRSETSRLNSCCYASRTCLKYWPLSEHLGTTSTALSGTDRESLWRHRLSRDPRHTPPSFVARWRWRAACSGLMCIHDWSVASVVCLGRLSSVAAERSQLFHCCTVVCVDCSREFIVIIIIVIIGSRPSDHYFRSVCLFVVQSFFQPSLIRFRSN